MSHQSSDIEYIQNVLCKRIFEKCFQLLIINRGSIFRQAKLKESKVVTSQVSES